MKSAMTVKVEFLAGTDIKEAIEEAKQKAIQWNVAYVGFDFNGVSVSVGQKCDVTDSMDKWRSRGGIGSKHGYIFN